MICTVGLPVPRFQAQCSADRTVVEFGAALAELGPPHGGDLANHLLPVHRAGWERARYGPGDRRLGAVSAGAIVLALLSEPDGLAAKILHDLGASDDAVTAAFGLHIGDERARGDAATLRQFEFADDGKDVLGGTLKAVLRLGHNYVGTEHLLLGALFANGSAATTLHRLGVTVDGVESGIATEIARIRAERRGARAS